MWMPFFKYVLYVSHYLNNNSYIYIILYIIYINTCLRLDKSFLQHLLLWNPMNFVEYLRIFQCHPFCSKHHGTSMAPNVPVRNDVATPGRHLDTKKFPAHLCVGDSVQNFLPENFGTWRVSYLKLLTAGVSEPIQYQDAHFILESFRAKATIFVGPF